MHKPPPRKIIHVTMLARHKETHRHGIDRLSVPLGTVRMDEPRPFRAIEVLLDVEQPRVVFGHHAALDATEPTRKRLNRNADVRMRIVWIVQFRFADRRLKHPLDLRSAHLAHLLQETRLLDQMALILLPRIQPHRHDREIRKVNHRPRSVCPQQLTWTNIANSARVAHDQASSPFTPLPLSPLSLF